MGGGGGGFRATFGGTGGNARKLVYLVDASGSLIDTLPFVIRELQRSIGQLSDKQAFTVIFFQGDDAIEVPPFGLKRATADAKQAVIQWVDPKAGNITPMNQSNPVKAIREKSGSRYQARPDVHPVGQHHRQRDLPGRSAAAAG